MDSRSNPSNLGQRMAVGAGWTVLLRFADRAVGLVSLAILARLLLPEDFGLLGLAVSLIGVIEIFGQLGVEVALIKDQQAEPHHYNSAWTINIIKGLLLAGIGALAAAPAAAFFRDPRVEGIIYWLALASAIGAFENIGTVNFRKNLEFNREFYFLFSSRMISTLATVGLALYWREYWALVAGVVIQKVTRVSLSYILQNFRPKISFVACREIFSFSKWLLVQNLINGLNSRVDALILGRLTNAHTLALYSLAYEISNLASTELKAPIRRAMLPGFAQMAEDRGRLKKGFQDTFALICLLMLPIPAGIALTAPFIVPVFLGQNWLQAIPLIQVLALYGMVQSFSTNSHLVYLVVNRPQITAYQSGLQLILLVPLLTIGVKYGGALGAAWALIGTAVLVLIVDFSVVLRVLELSLADLLASVRRPIAATVVMAIVLQGFQSLYPPSVNVLSSAVVLAGSIVIGALTYLGILLILWYLGGRPAGPESQLVAWTRDRSQELQSILRLLRPVHKTRLRASDINHPQCSSLAIFGLNTWNNYWQTRQQIASRLGKRGWPVLYSTGPLYLWDRHTPLWQAATWRQGFERSEDVRLHFPGRWPPRWPTVQPWDGYAIKDFAKRIKAADGWSSAPNKIAYLFHPSFYPYLQHLGECYVVYHADDAFRLMPDWTPELEEMQDRLVERADLLIASSPGMARSLPGCGPSKARLLPNGVDLVSFTAGADLACPSDLAMIPFPRIGYTGSINLKVDLPLVIEIARRRPDWNWVFVGPLSMDLSWKTYPGISLDGILKAFDECKNIHFLGVKPFQILPAYVSHMDVNTMCYRSDPGGWWTALSPLKLHEYLAVGKPVVSAELEAVKPFGSVIALAHTVDDWIAAIEEALHTGGVGTMTERQAVAMNNSWDLRVDQLELWLRDMIQAGYRQVR